MQGPFECVCNWSLDYAVFSRIGEHDHFLRTLVVLSYFFIPFTLTNLLTIICCIWVRLEFFINLSKTENVDFKLYIISSCIDEVYVRMI